MKRPAVTLENHEAVYDFYEAHDVSPTVTKLGFVAMSKLFKPDINYAPGAKAAIKEGFEDGNLAVVASNHVNEFDQFQWAALPLNDCTFAPLMDGTVIPSKPSLFRGGLRHPLRWTVDELASVPAFRVKDHVKEGETLDPVKLALQRAAKARLIELIGHKQADGYHLAIFPEGERNKVNVRVVQPSKDGLGEMYFASPPEVGKMIIPMALYYGEKPTWRDARKPTLYIGRPLVNAFVTPAEISANMTDLLQTNLDVAIELHEAKL